MTVTCQDHKGWEDYNFRDHGEGSLETIKGSLHGINGNDHELGSSTDVRICHNYYKRWEGS